ncbi:MAG: cell wall hydrolase [Pontiellaceae bacterium]|jgi:spore germination cell wall hydrolase CwlJ-like protein|nr:cell wall hydrolase [Pontiellaceae bacterium]
MLKPVFLISALLLSPGISRAQTDNILTGDARRIIAACMVLEAGGEGIEGMQAVLNVMLNRAQGSLCGMVPQVLKRGAFSCMAPVWCDKPDFDPLFQRAEKQIKPYEQAQQLINLLEEGCLLDNSLGATHFHAASILPYWADDLCYLTTIGNHIFYIERDRRVEGM